MSRTCLRYSQIECYCTLLLTYFKKQYFRAMNQICSDAFMTDDSVSLKFRPSRCHSEAPEVWKSLSERFGEGHWGRQFFPGCMSDIYGMSNSMTLGWKMSCQPHVPIFDIISIRILGRKILSRWSVLPCRLFRLQGHFSENCACRRDHHSVRRSFHESSFCEGSSSKNGQTLGNDWVTKLHN